MQLPPAVRARLMQPPFIIGLTAAVAFISITLTLVYSGPSAAGDYVHPIQGAILQQVSAPGSVKAADQVDLSFERAGRITRVNAVVGAHASAGTVLASIDSSDLYAALEQARAALAMQQAKLDALQAGSRPESIAVAQAAVDAAQASYAQAIQNLITAVQGSYGVADDAVHNKVDQLFNNPRTISPTLLLQLSDSQLLSSLVSSRVTMESTLATWDTTSSSLTFASSDASVSAAATLAGSDLQQVRGYLDQVAEGLTKAIPTTAYPTATITGLESTIALARTNVTTATGGLNSALTALTASRGALTAAQAALTLAKAPATTQDIAQQQAQVAAAEANVDAANAQLAKAALRAPFSGTITVNNAHLGAIASPSAPIISMISDSKFQFETYVSEADVAKVKVGDGAQVMLDAYKGADALDAHVVAVDPAATIQNGVSAYKITLQFDVVDTRIKTGLSGSVVITTETKQDTLTVPTSAIITKGNNTYVMRRDTSGDALVPVTVGITSGTGATEVLSGVTTGDQVRAFTN